jgi:hypothetical protein
MIDKWVQKMKKKHPDASDIEFIKENLKNKNYATCKIYDSDKNELESQTWEYEQLDPVLKRKFRNKQKIRIAV